MVARNAFWVLEHCEVFLAWVLWAGYSPCLSTTLLSLGEWLWGAVANGITAFDGPDLTIRLGPCILGTCATLSILGTGAYPEIFWPYTLGTAVLFHVFSVCLLPVCLLGTCSGYITKTLTTLSNFACYFSPLLQGSNELLH